MKFLDQNRPEKVKAVYRALKRDHPEMSAEMKARIASRKGSSDPMMRKSPKHGGRPHAAPITKEGAHVVGTSFLKVAGEYREKAQAERESKRVWCGRCDHRSGKIPCAHVKTASKIPPQFLSTKRSRAGKRRKYYANEGLEELAAGKPLYYEKRAGYDGRSGPKFDALKKGKVPLTPDERQKVMAAKATWNQGIAKGGKRFPVPAVHKSVVGGKTWFYTNTHRAYNVTPTLQGAIGRYHKFIKGTA